MLLDALVKPAGPIPPEAPGGAWHRDIDVAGAPTWATVGRQVSALLTDRMVIAHHADFETVFCNRPAADTVFC
ncbi:MAG: hypothetical protein CBHOC_4003 [uncultured Caballeronia sp.]|nr:MAG: hypothetical protein CBHOC_4003 [uncultured Caballeronia sp.]